MVRIPQEYQEVEYLESTGTQYIDTGIYPQLNDAVEITFYSDVVGDHLRPFGAYIPGVAIDGYQGFRIWAANNLNKQVDNTIYGKINNIKCLSDGTWILNDEVVLTDYPINTNDQIAITIFKARYANGSLYGDADMKLYDFTYKRNGASIQNLIPCYRKSDNESGMYDTVSKQFYTNSGTGTFLVGNDVNYSNTNLLEVRRRILLNTPHIEAMSGNPAIFSTDMAANLKECKIRFSPVQAGEGAPSPENVRAISGWDGVSVTKASKNLIDFNTATYIYHAWVNNGVIKPTVSYNLYSFKIPQNTILTLSRNKDTNSVGCVCAISTEDAAVGRSYSVGFPTITNRIYYTFNSGDCNYLWFCIVSSADISIYEWQLEVGNNRTSYESPSSTSISIPFPQTIYGGYVDLIKGEVVEEWIKVTLDGENVKLNKGGYSNTLNIGAGWVYTSPIGVTNVLAITENIELTTGYGTAPYLYMPTNGSLYLILYPVKKADYPDIDTTDRNQVLEFCNNWLKNNIIGVSYKLATPNTYTLTPQTIRALKGLNNLWSDANGNIEVKFWSHEQYQTLSGEYEITNDNYLLTTNDGYVIDF